MLALLQAVQIRLKQWNLRTTFLVLAFSHAAFRNIKLRFYEYEKIRGVAPCLTRTYVGGLLSGKFDVVNLLYVS